MKRLRIRWKLPLYYSWNEFFASGEDFQAA